MDSGKRADLLQLAERPCNLDAPIRVWIADHKLGSRSTCSRRMVHIGVWVNGALTVLTGTT